MRRLIWLGCMSYFIIGAAHVVMGSVMEPMTDYYGREYADGGQLVFNQFSGFLAGVLGLPWIIGRLGKRKAILLAFTLLTAAEIVYSLKPSWGWMLTIAPIAGCGFGMIEAIIGAMIIDYVRERKAAAMSRVEVFFGLGALFIPAASGLLIVYYRWDAAFLVVAAISLLGLLLWRPVKFGEWDAQFAEERRKQGADAAASASARYTGKEKLVLSVMAVFFFVYVGVEMSVVNFLPSMQVHQLSMTPGAAALSITIFWAAMSVGRMFAGTIAERVGYANFLIVCCLGSLAALAGFIFAARIWSSYAAILLYGLMMSGLFAIALVFANQLLPGKTNRTTSILIASGGIGGAAAPRMSGWLMDAAGTVYTQWVLAGLTAALLLLIAAVRLVARRRTAQVVESAA